MNENAKKWVAALRSGEYRQCKSRLHRQDEYCCLGVAEELRLNSVGESWVAHPELADEFVVPGWTGEHDEEPGYAVLSKETQDWLGLASDHGSWDAGDNPRSLISMNDHGKTFAEIADIIESEPAGLFVESTP